MKQEIYNLKLFCDNSPQEHEMIDMTSSENMAMCVSGCRDHGWAVATRGGGALCPVCSGKVPRFQHTPD